MRIRWYYSFDELSDFYGKNEEQQDFNIIFTPFFVHYVQPTDPEDHNNIQKLYDDIYNAYYDDAMLYVDVDYPNDVLVPDTKPTPNELFAIKNLNKQCRVFMRKIKAWLEDSSDRYLKLLRLYKENENKLLNKIESINTTQFNDTPQSVNNNLDADGYASTYTKNINSTDGATIMNRLNEVRAAWSSLLDEWVLEFGKKFIIH